MTSFMLKIIALISMTFDHFGDAIIGKFTFFNLLGRISFPIFAFQISEGYIHTKNLKKYFIKLVIFAVLSQIPFILFFKTFSTNFSLDIFFTLLIGLLCIYIYDKLSNKIIGIIICIALIIISLLIHVDYGAFGVSIILIFYIFKKSKLLMSIFYIFACILKYLPNLIIYNFHYLYCLSLIFTCIPIIFILLYNGKQGKKVKYLLYFYYPIHLFVLYLINVTFLS